MSFLAAAVYVAVDCDASRAQRWRGHIVIGGAVNTQTQDDAFAAAVRSGDQGEFGALAERYRRQLHVHCYRMVGSFEDAEDLVQETLLRAWRSRDGFEGRAAFKTWLFRIATNVCLNALERAPRRVMPPDVAPASADPGAQPRPAPEVRWLEPYPDQLLDLMAPSETEPDAIVVSRESIELAYLAALQHLPPRQRAILILRGALGWSAMETAAFFDSSVVSVNSALQRARGTMRALLPERQAEWPLATEPNERERAALQTFMNAFERRDADALAAILREDARQMMPPAALWFDGRGSIIALHREGPFAPGSKGDFRMLPTSANRQPAAACYFRPPGASEYRLVGLNVLRIEGGKIAEITSFGPDLCAAFGLSPTL